MEPPIQYPRTPEPLTQERHQRRILVPLLAILAFWIWTVPSLELYNVTWDEALGDLFFGERYLSYFTSFDSDYLDFQANPYPEDREPNLFVSPFKVRPWEYYPVANTLAAATSVVFSRWLEWLDPFDGFHALNLLLGALLIWFLYRFLERRWGAVAGLVAVGLLFTAPRVFCHTMANIKDVPLMVFYALAALVFYRAFEDGSSRGILGAAVLMGLALGTKANALFFPGIPLGVLILGGVPDAWKGRTSRLLLVLLLIIPVAFFVMFLAWPYLWEDPIGRFSEHIRYISERKGYTRAESMAPVFEAIFLTTPPVFLGLAFAGIVEGIRRALKRDRLAIFFLVWVGTVLFRFFLPQAVNFDGVRHFLELFPALAALAGLGASTLLRLGSRAVPALARTRGRAVATGLLLVPGLFLIVWTHPFQIAYWNVFAGGADGADARNLPQAGDYWGMSYRLGTAWLSENAPENALVVVPVVEHAVRLVAPVQLRDDLLLLPVTTPFSPRIDPERLRRTIEAARTRPLYVMFVLRRDWMNVLMQDCLERLEPEMAWTMPDGAPVLFIYRYEPPPGLPAVHPPPESLRSNG